MKELFLGGILVVLLYLLWRKEQGQPPIFASGPGSQPSTGGCTGCSGPSAAAAPVAQQTTWDTLGMGGQISPGTPPLQAATGVGSFYGPNGPTPDTTFTNVARPIPISAVQTRIFDAAAPANVPGSPTTPSTEVPVRASQPTGSYSQIGFQQRYNFVGVPRVYSSRYVM